MVLYSNHTDSNHVLEQQLSGSECENEVTQKYDSLRKHIENLEKENSELSEQFRVIALERDRLRVMNDMQQKEAVIQWENNTRLQQQLTTLREQLDDSRSQYEQANSQLQATGQLLEQMRNTRGWRMLEKLRRVTRHH